MKKRLPLLLSLASSAAMAGVHPFVSPDSVKVSMDARNNLVVTYDLADQPGVVTVDLQIQQGGAWTSLGAEHFTSLEGSVNCIVEPQTGRKLVWRWREDMPTLNPQTISVKAIVTAWPLDNPPDYMVIDLANAPTARRYYASEAALPGGLLANADYRLTKLVMRRVHATGVEWRMGYPRDVPGDWWQCEAECPPRHVTLSKDYYLGVFPVTQGQFRTVLSSLPDGQMHDPSATEDEIAMCPVNGVSMPNLRGTPTVDHYCSYLHGSEVAPDSWMQKFRDITGGAIEFDIPTEAEWEYAARAGTSGECYAGGWGMVANCGWYSGNSNGHTHPVGTFPGSSPANPWGLYDIVGNVLEPVKDAAVEDRSGFPERDPLGTVVGFNGMWVFKGGYYYSNDVKCRVTFYDQLNDYWVPCGIRLVCPAVAK